MTQQVINIKGLEHPEASPIACRIGPLLVSGAINGKDPVSGTMPDGVEEQSRNAFANMVKVLEAAGMRLDDVAKITIYVKSDKDRQVPLKYWAQYFPDPNRRPARRTFEAPIHAGIVQIEIIAYKA